MKKVLLSSALFLISFIGFSQTKGISYQAVIIDPNPIQIPGSDVVSQPYVSKDVWIRFGIYSGTTLQYEELHKTKTDEYGLVNLLIGAGVNTGKAGTFTSLSWDGVTKNILTSVSFDQGGRYTDVSNQKLTYTPYTLLAETAVKLAGVLPIASGGTGATNAIAARTNLGLGNVDNTADVDKPVSIATLAILDVKESLTNKSTNIIADSASSVKYPSVKAIKDYVDARTSSANNAKIAAKATALETARTINGVPFDGTANITIPVGVTPPDANATTKGILQLAGDLSGTAAAPRIKDGAVTDVKIESVSGSKVTGDISGNAETATLASSATKLVTARTINGIAFDGTADITIPVGVTPADADATTKGILQLAGDLSGTAALPSIAENAVTTAKLANGSVTDAKINTVSGSKVTGDIAGNAATATKLTTARTINGTPFDGTADITITTNASTLSGTIGIVNGGTGASTAAAARTNLGLEIGTDVLAQRTFGTAANSAATDFVAATEKGANNGVATLGNNGKIPSTQIPAISFQNVNVVNSDATMTAIAGAQVGSIAIRTDNNNNYVLSALPASTLSNWIALATPLYVSTVNGYAGPNVVLTTNDVAEGTTNKYFTDARVRNAISATAPLNFNTTSGVLSMTAASGSSDGYLSSADFTRFNNKQTALTAGVDYATPSGNITGNAANVTGIVSIANGGTGTSTAAGALVALGAEPSANKSNDVDGDGSSITKFPTVKSIKDYVDRQSANAGVADNSITSAKINGTIAIAKGGTGASTAAGARTNLGLVIGTDVMAANFTTTLTGDVTGSGNGSFATTVNSVGGVSSSTIATLPGLISANTTAIAANTTSITANANSIATLNTNVAANTASITANSTDIATINTNLALKAPLASPAFTGTPTAPTPATSDNSTKVATTEYVKASITAANAGLSSIGAISGTSNANGATISGTTQLILTPADATNGGIVTSGTQTFAGAKTFNNDITVREISFGFGTYNKTNNIAIGRLALNSNNSDYNVAIGNSANTQAATSSGGYNVAVGYNAMRFPNSKYNVALGYQSFYNSAAPSSGDNNVAVGYQALYNPGTGANNTVLGFQSLYNGGANNSILGAKALYNAAGASNNVAVGDNAGLLFGAGSGTALTSSTQSIFIGSGVRAGTNTSTNEIAIGYNVVGNGSNTVTIGNYSNTANYFRGDINLTGNVNGGTWSGTTIGSNYGGAGTVNGIMKADGAGVVTAIDPAPSTGQFLTSAAGGTYTWTAASSVTGVPYTGATQAVDLGAYDLKVNGLTIGRGKLSEISNTGVGIEVLNSVNNSSGGTALTAVGYRALKFNTSGNQNSAFGYMSLYFNNTGGANSSLGSYSLFSNTTGGNNSAFGAQSLYSNSTGQLNSALGSLALYNNNYGSRNTAIGYKSLYSTASSSSAGTDGNYNTALGFMSGNANTTGSNNTFLGYSADAATASLTNATAIGNGAIVNASNTVQIGNYSVTSVVTSGTISATGFTGPLTGNASSATKLAATKNINGIAFDGSADITIAADANTLTGTTLASNVTASSLTSVGTITSGIWSATTIDIAKGGTGATTAADALTNLGAEASANRSTDITADAASTTKYPSVKTIKDYVDTRVASAGVSNGSITNAKLANSTMILGSTTMTLGGTVSSVTGLTSLEATNLTGTLSGTATALATGRTISTTGDVAYTSGTFDGSADVTGVATLAASGVSSGTYGSSTAIPVLTVDTKGRVTLASTVGITAGVSSLAYSTTGASNGGTISGTTLTLTAADATNPGLISTGAQTIAGAKTFSSDVSATNFLGNATTATTAGNITATSNTSLTSLANLATVGTITAGTWSGSVIGSNVGGAGTVSGLLKANGSGVVTAAVAGTDYQAPYSNLTNIGSLSNSAGYLKNVGTGTFTYVGSITDADLSTITTAGKVSNTATSATSVNTVNAIVARDASGNFTAGIITGTLSGTATTATNIAGGVVGSIPYQTAAGTTSLLAGNTTSTVKYLTSSGDGTNANAPVWATPSFVPYTGATGAVNLGAYDMTVNGLTVGAGKNGKAVTYSNTALGNSALSGTNTGIGANTAIGGYVLQNNTSGVYNTGVGFYSLAANTIGKHNTAVGYFALKSNDNTSGTNGSYNSAFGSNSLQSNTTGERNAAFGYGSIQTNSTGSYNAALGVSALNNATSATENTAVGYSSGSGITSGSNNVFIGSNAGVYYSSYIASPSYNNTGSNSVYIGYDVRPNGNNDANEVVISGYTGSGNGTIGQGSNTTTIGNANTTYSVIYGSTGLSNLPAISGNTHGGDFILKAQDGYSGANTNGGNLILTPGSKGGTGTAGIVQINGQVKITGGTPAAGEVLTSDANGLATWSPLTAVTSLGTFTTTSYAAGGTISGTILTLSAADATNPGLVSTGTQTFVGAKTFSSTITSGSGSSYSILSPAIGMTVSPSLKSGGMYTDLVGVDIIPAFNTNGNTNTASLTGLRVQGANIVATGAGNDLTNTAIGKQALVSNTTTANGANTAVGYSALTGTVTATNNTAIGSSALSLLSSGNSNTAVGSAALRYNTASNNTAIGSNALYNAGSASNNIGIGKDAAYHYGSLMSNNYTAASGTGNIFIGTDVRPLTNTDSYEIVIGSSSSSGTIGDGSNTTTIGAPNTTSVKMYGSTWRNNEAIAPTNYAATDLTIKGQDANTVGYSAGANNPGGNIILTPGASTGVASKGVVTLNSVLNVVAGTATTSVNGLSSSITAENAGTGNKNGGAITLTAGNGTGTGTGGNITLTPGVSTASASSTSGYVNIQLGTTTSSWGATISGTVNEFLEYNIQNGSTGSKAQSGYNAMADNGTDATNFVWMGINNSAFNNPQTYNIGGANDVSFLGAGNDMHVANSNQNKSIIFSTGAASPTFFNERMRITSIGNVGIGTASPTATLEVNGTTRLGGATTIAGAATFTSTVAITNGAGAGKVLTSDASGNASWSNAGGTVTTTSSSATYTTTSPVTYIIVTGSNTSTITLPTAAQAGNGREYTIKNVASVTVTVSAGGTCKIISDSASTNDTTASLGIEPSNNWMKLISDGTSWYVIRALF